MKKNIIVKIACLGLISSSYFSCTKETKVKEPPSVTAAVSENSSAAEIVDAAELLVGPYSFMHTYKLATIALKVDPTNKKAEFYSKLFKRFEAFRGILSRIKPILTEEQLSQLEKDIATNYPDSALKDFLLQGGGPVLKSADEIQDIVAAYFKSVNEFRVFLKKNEDIELKLRLNPYVFTEKIEKNNSENCQFSEVDGQFQVECDRSKIANIMLNKADIIQLRQLSAGELLYGIIHNSYSLKGLDKWIEASESRNFTQEESINFLFQQPGFGALRRDQMLSTLTEIGSDLSEAATWVIKNQEELCKKRTGHLFESGSCDPNLQISQTEQLIELLNRALLGPINIELKLASDDSQKRSTSLDVFAIAKNPIQNLSQIVPTSWNRNCDQPTSLKDNTVNGVFPNNDADLYLLKKTCF